MDPSERLAKLTPDQRAELERRLAGLKKPAASAPKKRRPGEPAVLSFAQERLWFLDRLEGPGATYNISIAERLRGPLQSDALEAALGEIVRRHEALRTVFPRTDQNQSPESKILDCAPFRFGRTDFSSRSPEDRESALRVALDAIARRPMDIAAGPLFSAELFRLGPEEHVLALCVHHIVADAWSFDVLYRELAALYPDFVENRPPSLPPLEFQYADFAAWQCEHLQGPHVAATLDFWRNRLAGVPPLLALPTDFSRPAEQTYRGGWCEHRAPAALLEQVRQLARENQATVFMVVLAAFQALLHRYSGQSEIVVGAPVTNRSRVEFEPLIGFFVNTLPLRADFSPELTGRALVQQMRRNTLEALSHGDLPFEMIVRELRPARNLSHAPLFQAALMFQQQKRFQFAGLQAEPLPTSSGTSKFDLTLFADETDDGLNFGLEYSSDLFTSGTASRILAHFETLLAGLCAAPAQPVAKLNLLGEAERRQILLDWNRTERALPDDATVHSLFEAQAARTPQAPAATFAGRTLTYTELDASANRLATSLRAAGVRTETPVGVFVERSLDMIVSVLGILKAGGCYIPLDPAFPPDRLAFMVEDARIPVLVTQTALAGSLPPHRARVLCVDRLEPQSSTTEPNTVTPANLAYVLYTSGSTGRPKGVQISHRAVVNLLLSMQREPGLQARDVLVAVTTLSFDIAGLELFLPLVTGARLEIASHADMIDGQRLAALLDKSSATVMQSTPATWRMLIESGWNGRPGLKALCGGEALPPDLAEQLLARTAELWNVYGPTETTIWSTCCRVTEPAAIDIGRPIDNTRIYILDAHLQPVPVGVPGELMIGGSGLARGYLNRPELTAERFVDDPFLPGEKMYRTGDLAQFRPDGRIACLGRLDHQVKIRGFRIELQEIESRLATHPSVRQAVVAVREDTPGDKRLVAYCVPHDVAPAADALRQHLQASLPDYMVPAAFVALPNLPLTPNGKIDRKALPAPDRSALAAATENIPPATPNEVKLAAIFQRLLGVEKVYASDNFFDLGGHSLLAARLMAVIEREFGQRLPLAFLFGTPTVSGLARILEKPDAAPHDWKSLVPIRPSPGKPVLFMVHGAGGNVLLYREVADALSPDVSVYGLQSRGLDHRTPPLTRVEDMAALYVEEMRAFQPVGPYHLAGYCLGGAIVFEMARLLEKQGQQIGLIALLDSFNLAVVDPATEEKRKWELLRQKAVFHLRNIASLGPRQLGAYFFEKLRMAREAAWEAFVAWRKARRSGGRDKTVAAPKGTIMSINHAAGWAYVPGSLRADVTLFQPQTNYDFMSDPQMGWGSVVQGKLEKVVLSANPHAMLIAPCSTRLAAELKRRLASSPTAT